MWALRCRLLAIVALGIFSAAPCVAQTGQNVVPVERNIHALFVGIDQYAHARPNNPNAQFDNLQGAVGDTYRFKQAMADFYGLQLDQPQGEACSSANAVSHTLINACATRKAILDALEQKIGELGSGETLLFYFAGHGSQYRDDSRDGVFDQASGYNSTIMPSDARDPDNHDIPGDIFDFELRAIKEEAIAKGIYFVTIFDSCNSGTATRDGATGRARSALPVPGRIRRPPETGPLAQGPGYWVHLAASRDGEEAQETFSAGVGGVGERAGVFTNALVETLRDEEMRNATFGDIIREVQLRVGAMGHISQNPMGEGELNAAMGTRSRQAVLFEAGFDGSKVSLEAGSLSGITLGSTVTLYANQRDAIDRAGQVGSGVVSALTEYGATVDVENTGRMLVRMFAEETARFYPPQSVTVSNAIPPGGLHDRIEQQLAGMEFIERAEHGAYRIVRNNSDPENIDLIANDGSVLASNLGEVGDRGFSQLRTELEKVARVQQLLALRTDANSDGEDLQFCIATQGYRKRSCPPLEAGDGGMRQLTPSRASPVVATVINGLDKDAYIYVFAIDRRNGVDLIIPRPGEPNSAIAPSETIQSRAIRGFGIDGLLRFIVIATEQPIRAEALQQSGSGTNSRAVCASALERLLCSANRGTRDPGVQTVGGWTAIIATARVRPEGESP